MKKDPMFWLTLIVSIGLFVAFVSSATAQVIINDHATDTEIADHFANNDIIATIDLRRDNTSAWDIRASASGSPIEDIADYDWIRNVSYGFTVSLDASGNFEFTLTPPGEDDIPITVGTALTNWVTGGIVEFDTPGFVNISLSGNINGTSFDDLVSVQGGGSDAFIFNFPDNGPSNQPPFTLNGTMDLNSPIALTNGSFGGKVILTQDPDAIPEPSSALLIFLATAPIFLFKRRLK